VEVTPLFSRAINDYKENPKFIVPHALELVLNIGLMGISAFIVIIAAIALMPSGSIWEIEAFFHGNIPFFLISLIVFIALSLFTILTLLSAVARATIITMAREIRTFGKTDLRSGFDGAKRYAGGLFLFKIITGLVFFVLLLTGAIPFALGSVFLGLFAMALSVIIFLAFYVFVFFTPQFIVTHESGVISSLKDSMNLVEDNLSSVLIYIAVVTALSIGIAVFINILGLPGMFIENEFLNMAFVVFHSLFSLGVNLLIAPYFDIVKTHMVMEVN